MVGTSNRYIAEVDSHETTHDSFGGRQRKVWREEKKTVWTDEAEGLTEEPIGKERKCEPFNRFRPNIDDHLSVNIRT